MIRVLVVEDSAVTREYLVFLLGEDPAIEVAGTARDGVEALEKAKLLKPDVITMDAHLPGMNGCEATKKIMEQAPAPIVMVSASSSGEEAVTAFDALLAGALTLVDKPSGPDDPAYEESVRKLVETVKLMAEVKVVRRWPKRDRQTASPPSPSPFPSFAGQDRKLSVIAIGASTGGPQVLAEILRAIPAGLVTPILVVQHIARGFLNGLAEWLGQTSRLQVKVAASSESARPGTVYLAPEGSQMGITKGGRIVLAAGPEENGFCPSVSYLFRSVAETYGSLAMGILLSGMGTDGAAGLFHLRKAGGVTVAQDEQSSIIFGMPGEAVRLGAAEYVLSPEQVAGMIRALAGQADGI